MRITATKLMRRDLHADTICLAQPTAIVVHEAQFFHCRQFAGQGDTCCSARHGILAFVMLLDLSPDCRDSLSVRCLNVGSDEQSSSDFFFLITEVVSLTCPRIAHGAGDLVGNPQDEGLAAAAQNRFNMEVDIALQHGLAPCTFLPSPPGDDSNASQSALAFDRRENALRTY